MLMKPARYIFLKYIIPLGLLAGMFSFITISGSKDNDGVIAQTNKLEYAQSETITITVTNYLKEDIYSAIGSGTPVYAIKYVQRKICGNKWEDNFAQCKYPNCKIDIDAPQAVKPGESKSMEWNPLLFVDGTSKSVQAGSGKYRLVILYTSADRKEWKTIYSNSFVIH
ncbi:MAG: hypothetical protein WC780_15915 [Lentimicrobiaceae bacterium]|jgi:hypothetical protein